MLSPAERTTYLSELRPPEGYQLERVIATTYTLDLISLLMAPMSMVLWECEDPEQLDPMAVFHALEEMSGKFTIFCEQSRIQRPPSHNPLFGFLEEAVVEVVPPGGPGSPACFHPKTWLLKFIAPEQPPIFRFLCLSRNLTFDRSWDTVLSIEGTLREDRSRGFSLNQPLAAFLEGLVKLAARPMPARALENLNVLASEVRRVEWVLPEGFEDFEFAPIGNDLGIMPEFDDKLDSILMVSPFLSETTLSNNPPLQTLAEKGANNFLVSRQESLDSIPDAVFKKLEKNCRMFVMHGDAELPDEEGEVPIDTGDQDLQGLHAKLVITERGARAWVCTGSANATAPAWDGRNVEFMTILLGRRNKVGIKPFLEGEKEKSLSFMSILAPYQRSNRPRENDAAKRIDAALEEARRAIAGAGIQVIITPEGEDKYTSTLTNENTIFLPVEIEEASCWPIMYDDGKARNLSPLQARQPLSFNGMDVRNLTGFFVFAIQAKNRANPLFFVLNLPVQGMPQDRGRAIVRHILSDKKRFLRYLFLLLSGDDETTLAAKMVSGDEESNGESQSIFDSLQLMEQMVRALVRRPEKIDRVARIVEEIRAMDDDAKLLPEHFDRVWLPVWEARQAQKEARK